MNELRRRVDSLRRRMARELAIQRTQEIAQEYCMRWHVAESDHTPLPDNHSLIARIHRSGLYLPTLPSLEKYLLRCRANGDFPLWEQICRVLLPWVAALHMTPPPPAPHLEDA